MKFWKILVFILLGILLFLGLILGYFFYEFNYSKTSNFQKQNFTITSGEGVGEISANLTREKIYFKTWVLKAYLFYSGNFSHLQAGSYLIPARCSLKKLIEIFALGKTTQGKITIQEGWRISQIADYLEKEKIINKKDFLAVLQASLYKVNFPEGFSGENLEGLLFPDTYYFTKDSSEKEIVELMLKNFQKRTQNYALLKNSSGLSEYEVIILASIVEREAKTQKDRELVASVYLNRIRAKMKLESCPTVQYAKSLSWEKITAEDTKNILSAYNTYIYFGFPPTPIASPGLESIQAVQNAPSSDFYYFFNNTQGKIIFSKTAEEHIQKQKES